MRRHCARKVRCETASRGLWFTMKKLCRSFGENDTGATSIEYALIASIISLAIIAGSTQIGSNLKVIFTSVATNISK
jgi:pilus assembly protein Flp/PilA